MFKVRVLIFEGQRERETEGETVDRQTDSSAGRERGLFIKYFKNIKERCHVSSLGYNPLWSVKAIPCFICRVRILSLKFPLQVII